MDDVSFEVEAGQSFALLSPNGAAKTMTFSILTAILTPTAATARIVDYDELQKTAAVRQRSA